ncbi:MAG: DUF4012 domain-containing protein [Candidatus Moraniibacteriota bacterium]
MSNKIKNKILPQMFDVRPVDANGDLDFEKINKIVRISKINTLRSPSHLIEKNIDTENNISLNSLDDEKKRFQEFILREKDEYNADRFRINQIKKKTFFEHQKQERERELQKQHHELLMAQIEKQKRIAQEEEMRQEEYERQQAKNREQFIQYLADKQKRKTEKIRLKKIKRLQKIKRKEERKKRFNKIKQGLIDILRFSNENKHNYHHFEKIDRRRYSLSFFIAVPAVFLLIFGASFFYRGLKVRGLAIENGKIAYANLTKAKDEIKNSNFNRAAVNFDDAYERFDEIKKNIDGLGKILVETSRFVPFLSKLSSGSHLAEAGKDISRIGELATEILQTLNEIKNPNKNGESISYLKIFQDSNKNIVEISAKMDDLEDNLAKINMDDIPENQRSQFIALKQKLPEINKFMDSFAEEEKILVDVLGGNGPRKYLFLFQNNQEMRATGGFIGTYAVLDISNGNIKNFFVDGIFNPDGQLREKIIPPIPIQKISANWSLHDSNWFPDFPKSAEKASWFYEKTGGPTVDGVITMTPTVMQRLLEITGPIEMPEYSMTIDKDNFLENIQTEVEIGYDKDLNQPKKVLADLTPKILDRIFNTKNISDFTKTIDILLSSLNEKHILIYSKNYDIEKILSKNGWSGEILDTRKDYLSVINTNINGYKTDGVVAENISHKAEIQSDGSIINTVTITRQHNGGNTPYEWWNKVNSDYMRVYVPKGSKLIHVSGQTKEFNSPPLDYKALGFKQDVQLIIEEESVVIDEESGTRIYEDSGKTVFANWVYVSPQESVKITYSYILPFKLDMSLTINPADAYSILFQKQSGSIGSDFSSTIIYPDFYKEIWRYPEQNISMLSDQIDGKTGFKFEDKLKTDKFIGVAFGKE